MKNPLISMVLGLGVISPAVPATAAEPLGFWLREQGVATVEIKHCGSALCGNVVWLKDPKTSPGRVGQQVFFDMKPEDATHWKGSAFNPEDGKTYTGTLEYDGGETLVTQGCVMGGLFCKTVNFTRTAKP